MKKVFITGIAGFLGSSLAKRFLELGYQVSGNDSLIGGYIDNIPLGAKFYPVDCTNFLEMKKALSDCELLIHAAATAHEGLSVFSPSMITRNIFEASVTTLSAFIANKGKRFVFCSSMARYGIGNPPFRESDSPAPEDPYGIAKVAFEQILVKLSAVHGYEYNIAVPHNIIGPGQVYDDPFRNVVSIMFNRALQGKDIIVYGNGSQTRCFSYVDDCLYCLIALATDPKIKSEVVNIGPDEEVITILEVANLVKNLTGTGCNIVFYPDRPLEVRHAICSSDKARKLLNYKTSTSLEEALKKTGEYIANRGTLPFDYRYELEISNERTPVTWAEKKF